MSSNGVNSLCISSWYPSIVWYPTMNRIPHCRVHFILHAGKVAKMYISSNTLSNILSNFTLATSVSNQVCISGNAVDKLSEGFYAFFSSLMPTVQQRPHYQICFICNIPIWSMLHMKHTCNAVNSLCISSWYQIMSQKTWMYLQTNSICHITLSMVCILVLWYPSN